MRIILLLGCFFLFGCNNENVPDVSGIKVPLEVKRFEKDFFNIDTNDVHTAYAVMQTNYHSFLQDFLFNVLAVPEQPDSAREMVSRFVRDYRPIYKETQKQFPDLKKETDEIRYSFQLTKHYFPSYNLPKNIITFIGPVEGYGTILTQEGVAIGLQQYLGKDFPAYQTSYVRDIYPDYQVRRFERAYIPVNVMKNIVEDIFPSPNKQLPLIDIMIEQGKRLYLLEKLMPSASDTLLTGYTKQQLEGCYENEGLIWNFFIQNDLLYQSDPFIIRDYISDGPKTAALGEGSPGNIGQFVGLQIVRKYMNKKEVTLDELMRTSDKVILAEAKYKPR